MGRTLNPTRPAATTAEVRQRLKNLGGVKRKRLGDWGYPIAGLDEWAARGDEQADEVDALLAIILNRADYTHDGADVAAAEKIGKKLGARVTPHAHLVSQHKAEPLRTYNLRPGYASGRKPMSAWWFLVVFGGVFLVIVLVAVISVLLR